MRGAIGSGLVISLAMLCASQASARDVKISGTHSLSNIEMSCINNGGTFFNGANGGYGCAGSGGGTVSCTKKGKCTGTVSRVAGKGGKGSGINGVVNALNRSSGSAKVSTSSKTTNTHANMGQTPSGGNGSGMHQGGGHHR
jgi:hypothetical protein